MLFNGLKFLKKTNDIAETILKLKPDVLHTDIYVTVSKQKEILAERKLNLIQGRKLFLDEGFLQVFINNLLLN